MEDGFSSEAILAFLKDHFLLVGISSVGAILLIYGFFTMNPFGSSENTVVYEAGTEANGLDSRSKSGMTDKNSSGTIYVDIAGAVVKPGVYPVPEGSRVADVLTKAGGLADKADKQGIAKTMNLATKVTDGMKIYFPFTGETGVLGANQTAGTTQTGSIGSASTQAGGLININTDSESQLDSLPGVGAVTAGKIIAGRPYASVEELKSKKVVGDSVYEKIKDLVTVN